MEQRRVGPDPVEIVPALQTHVDDALLDVLETGQGLQMPPTTEYVLLGQTEQNAVGALVG